MTELGSLQLHVSTPHCTVEVSVGQGLGRCWAAAHLLHGLHAVLEVASLLPVHVLQPAERLCGLPLSGLRPLGCPISVLSLQGTLFLMPSKRSCFGMSEAITDGRSMLFCAFLACFYSNL